ncbi:MULTISPECIES: fimbrial protein [Atlantibacter]|uniref:fimbrial protein n=1 Tax=Atlantibacter TaxID=1903434 RepID=UPI0016067A82|nr:MULTISPECIES: fimbrial protein [Atlantibacter]MBB3320864.1 type 1 fimbria pilin [Atlantibacter sp. RC6]MCZ7836100.1 type 1 fimbrial protein [Atlantibacter hermannii]
MKLIANLLLTLFCLSASLAIPAQAADVTININGTITPTPCEMSGGTSMDVDLGKSEVVPGFLPFFYSNQVPFTVVFINCPVAYDMVNVRMEGDWGVSDGRLKNTGTAKNVAVDVYYSRRDGGTEGAFACAKYSPDCNFNIDKTNGTVTINYYAFMASDTQITAGTVSAQMVLTLTYQ